MEKYFAYHPDAGFYTYPTAELAKEDAELWIEEYREAADDGWSEDVENICWGEIKQQATEIKTGAMIMFDGEESEAIDYVLAGDEIAASTKAWRFRAANGEHWYTTSREHMQNDWIGRMGLAPEQIEELE